MDLTEVIEQTRIIEEPKTGESIHMRDTAQTVRFKRSILKDIKVVRDQDGESTISATVMTTREIAAL